MNVRTDRPIVSFVLATCNRREVVRRTLSALAHCGLDRADYEIIVVDNQSTDGTPEAVAPLCDRLLRPERNLGSCAKALGVEHARGRYVVFLDDDSHPRPGCAERMIGHFEADAALGAAGFLVHLPDGRLEGAALPEVFLGCGVGLRKEALDAVGGLDLSFFMQAEEYDLAFRLAGGGWRVRMFPDLHVDHLKTAQARRCDRTVYLDTRNNLRVIARYLPDEAMEPVWCDVLQRYRYLAEGSSNRAATVRERTRECRIANGEWRINGAATACPCLSACDAQAGVSARRQVRERLSALNAYARGAWRGWWERRRQRRTYRPYRLRPQDFERFFAWGRIERAMGELAATGVRCVLFSGWGKNVYPYFRAARRTGLTVVAVADDRFAGWDRWYRGLPIVPWDVADDFDFDAVVIADTSPVHGTVAFERTRRRTDRPVHHWFPFPISEGGRTEREDKNGNTRMGTAGKETRVVSEPSDSDPDREFQPARIDI